MKTAAVLLTSFAASAVAELTTSVRTSTEAISVVPLESGSIDPGENRDGSCKAFVLADPGQTCRSIVASLGGTPTFEQFVAWNPIVGPNCSRGLIVGVPYCVGMEAVTPTGTATPTGTTTPTETAATTQRTASLDACEAFYQAVASDDCVSVMAAHGNFTMEEFVDYNPTVGDNCANGLMAGAYYYVGGDEGEDVTVEARSQQTSDPLFPILP